VRAISLCRAVALVALAALSTRSAGAGLIIAQAKGSSSPTTSAVPFSVINGDFTIAQPTMVDGNDVVGDGINEVTTWTLDFAGRPGYASFVTHPPLTSALLTLTLTPGESFVSTDAFAIGGLPSINSPAVQGLSVGSTQTVQVQLLDYYSSTQILGRLTSLSGKLNFIYQDDAVVSFAELKLVSTPEPSTLISAGTAVVVGLGYGWRRRRKARA
jgi:hypothetical protein